MPTLSYLVSHILSVSSEKQVLGINTQGHITAVQHVQPIGDWAAVEDPGQTMRSYAALLTGMVEIERAIDAASISPTTPQPASIGLQRKRLREPRSHPFWEIVQCVHLTLQRPGASGSRRRLTASVPFHRPIFRRSAKCLEGP